jgi:hypothetical protein
MGIFRDNMDRLLRDFEDSIIITNPNERIKTFFRKIIYKILVFWSRLLEWFS